MKFIITLLLVIIASLIVGVAILQEPGYVLVVYDQWSLETTLSLLLAGLIAAFALFYLTIRLVRNVWLLPRRINEWRRERRRKRARVATNRGLITLAEGHWGKAEKQLMRFAKESEMPLINYLGAARAAQKQGAAIRRDLYLADAHHAMPRAALAISITQAELQLAHRQYEEALATLLHLRSLNAKHPYVLHLLMRVHEQMGSWRELLALLPELRRHDVLDEQGVKALAVRAHGELLAAAAASQKVEQLREAWAQLPRELRGESELLALYVRYRMGFGDGGAECEELLRDALKHHYDAQLVKLYGQVSGGDLTRQLATAEGWLRDHERDPDLLLTLGRLALRNQLWGKGRNYLEASLGSGAQPETYCELANLLNDLGEAERSRELYRQGLQSAARESCTLLAERPKPRRRIQPGEL